MALIVQSGFAKGLRLATPAGTNTRPTSARVRAAIVNMLLPYAVDGVIADLYAGSGAVGIELISRGAQEALFIEHDASAFRILENNLDALRQRASSNKMEPLGLLAQRADVLTAHFAGLKKNYDCVWADPPYALALAAAENLLKGLPTTMADGGVFAIESAAELLPELERLADGLTGWSLLKQRHYGQTGVSLFQRLKEG